MLSLRTLSKSRIWLSITLVTFLLSHTTLISAKPAWKDDPNVESPSKGTKKGGGKNKASTTTSEILITEHPISIAVTEGEQALFSVSASSSDGQVISYQWQFNGQEISGAYAQSYSIDSALISNQGTYSVSLSTSDATETTSAALSVETAPPPEPDLTVSFHPMSQSAYLNESLTLNVSAVGSGSLRYQWRKDGSDISDANMAHLHFESLTLGDAGYYDVVVSNELEMVVSNLATIDISILPNVVLSWDTPNFREDGSNLSPDDIDSFNIYVSFENNTSEEVISVAGNLNSIDLNEMPIGSYNFAIATVDSTGITGPRSEGISIIVN